MNIRAGCAPILLLIKIKIMKKCKKVKISKKNIAKTNKFWANCSWK